MAVLSWVLPIRIGDVGGSHLQGSKVNNAVNVRVSLEDLIEAILLGDIELDEIGLLAANSLNPVEGLGGGVVQVISDNNLVASLEEGEGGEGANVTGTTMGLS
jgi:hypothetical protein